MLLSEICRRHAHTALCRFSLQRKQPRLPWRRALPKMGAIASMGCASTAFAQVQWEHLPAYYLRIVRMTTFVHGSYRSHTATDEHGGTLFSDWQVSLE